MLIFIGRKCTTSPFKAMCAPNTQRVSRELQSESTTDKVMRVTGSKLQWFTLHRHQHAKCPLLLQSKIWGEMRSHEFQAASSKAVLNDECRHGRSFSQVELECADSHFLHSGRRAERTDHERGSPNFLTDIDKQDLDRVRQNS